MGRMSTDEYNEFTKIEAVVYFLEVYHDSAKGLDKKDKISILNTLKRYQKQHQGCSYLYVESTKKNVSHRQRIKTGKPGRPKEIPIGTNVVPHVHIVMIGNANESAYTFGKKVEKAVAGRLRKNGLIGKRTKLNNFDSNEDAINFIAYSLRQADLRNAKGSFDFYKFDQIETRNYFGSVNKKKYVKKARHKRVF
jgi:hypothetical protein